MEQLTGSARRAAAVLLGLVVVAGGLVGALPEAAAAVSDTPDEAWVANGDVNSVFRAGSRIYLGGSFDEVGPATGSGVPLDPATGGRAAAFPTVNGPVFAVVPDGAGGWYIGGDFTRVGDKSRHNAARVLADGTVGAWNPNHPDLTPDDDAGRDGAHDGPARRWRPAADDPAGRWHRPGVVPVGLLDGRRRRHRLRLRRRPLAGQRRRAGRCQGRRPRADAVRRGLLGGGRAGHGDTVR